MSERDSKYRSRNNITALAASIVFSFNFHLPVGSLFSSFDTFFRFIAERRKCFNISDGIYTWTILALRNEFVNSLKTASRDRSRVGSTGSLLCAAGLLSVDLQMTPVDLIRH